MNHAFLQARTTGFDEFAASMEKFTPEYAETVSGVDRNLIVEAARQKGGHLYVETADCQVAVVGTLFSVRHGDKGSRVSVLEGEVHVDQGARRAVLRPGDQVSTSARLAAVPVGEDFAWSREADRYRELWQTAYSLRL